MPALTSCHHATLSARRVHCSRRPTCPRAARSRRHPQRLAPPLTDAKGRALAGLPNASDDLLPQVRTQRLAQPHRRGGLALPQRRGGDARHHNCMGRGMGRGGKGLSIVGRGGLVGAGLWGKARRAARGRATHCNCRAARPSACLASSDGPASSRRPIRRLFAGHLFCKSFGGSPWPDACRRRRNHLP